jgi:hypothetical protein
VKDGKDVINVPGKECAEGTLAVTLYAEAVQIKEGKIFIKYLIIGN